MAQEITKVAKAITKLADLQVTDLESRATCQQVVNSLFEAASAAKEAKALDASARSEIRRMLAEEIDSATPVVLYDLDNEVKVTVTYAGGGMKLDEGALLDALWAAYGEEPGDTKGKAWKAWLACTRPARVVDEGRVAEALSKGDELLRAAVESVTSEVAPTTKVGVAEMSKAERKALQEGELTEWFVRG